jgi:type II secretory pathway pseudopilin PulG
MIVVAIIAVIAAIAIPNMAQAKRTAEEKRAWQMVRAIFSGQQRYKEKNGTYATSLRTLAASGLAPANFTATGSDVQPFGYWEYSTRVPTGANATVSFRVMAEPVGSSTANRLQQGDQIFFMLESGAMYTHRYYQGCSLSHGDTSIQSSPDSDFGNGDIYLPTDGI